MNTEQRETLKRMVADFERDGCGDNMERMLLNAGKCVEEQAATIERLREVIFYEVRCLGDYAACSLGPIRLKRTIDTIHAAALEQTS